MRTTSSRLKGSLIEHKLCTTIALASIPKQQTQDKIFEVNLAWMGDSRIYFLSPTKGLQQLTKDDLVTSKDAFEMLRQDPPMSQYLTADINPKWQIHFQNYRFEEPGCFLACTDGCFQYVSAPWEFERLLLETLSNSEGTKKTNNWQGLIEQKYTEIKQDDVSLIIYAVGFQRTSAIKDVYQERLGHLRKNFISDTNNYDELKNLWEEYKPHYEHYLPSIQDSPPISHVSASEDESSTSGASTSKECKELTETFNEQKEAKIKKLLDDANSYYANYQLSKAQELCEQALKLQPYNSAAKYLSGVIYYELAKQPCNYQQKPKYLNDAASQIEEVIEQLSEKVKAYQILGKIYYDLKDWEKAVEFYANFFDCKGSEKSIDFDYVNSRNFDLDLDSFIASLRQFQSNLNNRKPANSAIQFCRHIIDNSASLSYANKPLIYYHIASLQEIEKEFNAALNSLKTLLELDLDYSMRQKATQKYEDIFNRLNNRR
jgi:hypothetical protein